MLINKIKKLLVMPKEEILFRIVERRLEKKEHKRYMSGKSQITNKDLIQQHCGLSSEKGAASLLFDDFSSGKRDRFFTEAYAKETRMMLLKKNHDTPKWLQVADRICEGKLCLLGQDVYLAEAGEWHKDPIEGREWPRSFYKQVSKNNRPSPTVDIKYVWEMNRHQYLIVLGKAYWISRDEKYAKKVCDIISSWIEDNPYHCGVNWTSSLELAVRSISWIWAYFFCQNSKHMDAAFHLVFLKSIYEHGRHMEQHLSYYSSPYNHLIGEAAGLHIIGSLFSQLNRGRKWEYLGWSILEKNTNTQFFDDGMCVEQATFYHHFTLGFYLQVTLLRKINNKPVSETVLSTIERALDVSMHLTQPNGKLPTIGDIDNARSLYFNMEHSWDFRGFLSLGAILFDRPDFKRQSSGFSEELLWLSDETCLEKFETMESLLPVETSRALSSSGYYLMRNTWEKDAHFLCFDCGEMAAGLHESGVPSAAHGHADALSFELSVFGKPILAEGGFNTYFGDLDWHRYFREEEAHNTLKIGTHKQAQYCGRLTWKSVINPKLRHWYKQAHLEFVCGEMAYNNETLHRREIVSVSSKFWIVSDQIQSGGLDDTATAYFHFDASIELEVDHEKKQILAQNGTSRLLMQYFGPSEVKIQRGQAGLGPEAGWQAIGYGYKNPAWRLSFTISLSQQRVRFPLLLLPYQEGDLPFSFKKNPPLPLNFEQPFCPEFSFNHQNYCVSFPWNASPDVRCEGKNLSK